MGNAFARDASAANAFAKLSRYEIPIQRILYQSLEKLMTLQQKRLHEAPPLRSLNSIEAG